MTELTTVVDRVVFTQTIGLSLTETLASVDAQGQVEVLFPAGTAVFNLALLETASDGAYVDVKPNSGVEAGTWFTDGTLAGTWRVGERTDVALLAGSGDEVSPANSDFEHGEELWVSDGTPAGTRLVVDVTPSFNNSAPQPLGAAGAQFLFAAFTLEVGEELHAIALADAGAFLARPFGQGCAFGAAAELAVDGELRLGESIEVQLSGLTPLQPAGFYVSLTAGAGALGECVVYIPNPQVAGLTVLDVDGAGGFSFSFPVDPALIGVEAYLQGASAVSGGPLLGSFELTDGLELVFGP